VPTVEGLQFAYALHELPPGRVPFRRWRWELWHGATLLHAGWTMFRPQAERALRVRAAQHGHALFGLRAPDPARIEPAPIRPGASVRFEVGPVLCALVPRTLVEERAATRA
jgi:hypothetical protein